jgi:hypothetical protein
LEASSVELPLNIKPYYAGMVEKEDPASSKQFADFKRQNKMSTDEYKSLNTNHLRQK